jgi:hypothetical protein
MVVFETMDNALNKNSTRKKTILQQGLGAYTLCNQCNNDTGAWYGASFVEWSRLGFIYLEKLGREKGSFYLPFTIKPLNVIKQILVMTLAMSVDTPTSYYDDLVPFLLDKTQNYLPPKFKISVYFNFGGQPRFESNKAVGNFERQAISYVDAEVALPPFGYCVTSTSIQHKSLADAMGLCDITRFAQYDYDRQRTVFLRLPGFETNEPFPLDYRRKDEIISPTL